jgi:hypothetical protein
MKRLVLAIALVGCSKAADPGPTCPQLVEHMLEVTKQAMPAHGKMELGNKKQMVQTCEDRKLTPAQRKCMMAASTLAALAECQKGVGSNQ